MSRDMALDMKDARKLLGDLIRARIVAEYGTIKHFAYQVGIDDVSLVERISQGKKKINAELAAAFTKAFGGSAADWINAENKILAGQPADVPIYEIPQKKQKEGSQVSNGTTSEKLKEAAAATYGSVEQSITEIITPDGYTVRLPKPLSLFEAGFALEQLDRGRRLAAQEPKLLSKPDLGIDN